MDLFGLSCIFPAPDIKKTAEFYVSALGFRAVEYLTCREPHICLYRDGVEVILLQENTARVFPNRELYGYGFDAYFYSDKQLELQQEFEGKGVKIVRRLSMTEYRNKEFVFEDIDGRWIGVGLKEK